MSRDLPYFKFFTSEWLNGDITLEDYELQGIFINLCAYYWHKDGNLDIVQVKKKLRTDRISELIDIGLIKFDRKKISKHPFYLDDNEKLVIEFLDEQLSEFSVRKKQLSEAGIKGAKRKKELALNKQPFNHPSTTREDKEKEKEKDKSNIRVDNSNSKPKTLIERKTAFKESLASHKDKYESKLLNEFYSYWTEHGEDDKKMRYEKQTSFSIDRRLGTWKTNEKKYGLKGNIKDNRATTTKAGRQDFS